LDSFGITFIILQIGYGNKRPLQFPKDLEKAFEMGAKLSREY
jgi:hypothetical protein